jgi:carbon starvation protein
VIALALASSLVASDYFAINTTPPVFATLGMSPSELPQLSKLIGFELQGKTGGVTSLAVSMTKMFSSLFGGEASMAVWYVFSIVFLGVFTMPIVDHGTRMARYLIQETLTMLKIPLNIFTKSSGAILMTLAWAYLLYTGEIGILWPMFGICNQLLACIGLSVGTAYIAKRRPKYAIVTYWPILLFASASIHGAILELMKLLPKGGEAHVQAAMLLIMIPLFLVILLDSTRRWTRVLKKQMNGRLQPEVPMISGESCATT